MANQKRAIRSAQREPCKAAYVKQYEAAPEFIFPKDFVLSRNDLLLSESIRRPGHTAVLLYWTCEERCRANEPAVEKALGLSNPEVIGDVVQVLTPNEPKWIENPKRWGQWLLSAAALFGALSVIQTYFTGLFGSPNVTVFVDNSAKSDFHAGDPLDILLKVRNQARDGQADVDIKSVDIKPLQGRGKPQDLTPDIVRVTQLQAGQNADVHVTGTSPSVANGNSNYASNEPPQRYSLEVSGRAKEGLFYPSESAAYRPFTSTIWPDRTWEVHVSKRSPIVARVLIKLSTGVGVAKGLRGTFIVHSPVALAEGGVISEGFTSTPTVSGDQGKIEFQTDAVQPFHRYNYSIVVIFSRALTQQEWASLQFPIIEVGFQ